MTDQPESAIARWEPPAIAPHPTHSQLGPAPSAVHALATLEAIRLEIERNTAALARYQPAPAPVPYVQPVAPVPYVQPAPQYHAPTYTAPTYTAPTYGDYRPTIVVQVDTAAHSSQDNGGHGGIVTFLGLGFFAVLVAALVGGQ